MNVVQAVAAGIHALPGTGKAFAAVQGAWRFFSNRRVTLKALVEPLRGLGREACDRGQLPFALLIHDWSKLDFDDHPSKKDQTQLTQALDRGYELTTVLMVDANDGATLTPMGLSVLSADGLYTTEADSPQPRIAHLEQTTPWMEASRSWGLSKTPVHVIDREADSIKHMRRWDAGGHLFLVRADNRRVLFREKSQLLPEITGILQQEGSFVFKGDVSIKERTGQQWIAETEVTLDGDGYGKTPDGKTCRVPGPPLRLRFVVVHVRDANGKLLAEWMLLTNVWDVTALQIALWYYWRWRIESFHKLLKSAGLEVEEWRQETALAITKRLLVGCMACVTVWALEREKTPEAEECKKFLVRLSGRQMKRSRPITSPALLAGLHQLLNMILLLEQYTPAQLRKFAETAAPQLRRSG